MDQLRELANGSIKAFDALYAIYQPRLHRYILPFVSGDVSESSSIVQDVFVKLWMKRETLPAIEHLELYLYRMARNRLMDLHRAQKKRRQLHASITSQAVSLQDETLLYREYYQIARQAIHQLPERRKIIFELFTQKDMAMNEIAASLNVSHPVIKKQLTLANNFIRQYIRRYGALLLLLALCIKIF